MRFSIGYQLPDEDDDTPSMVRDYAGQVDEVYFALPDSPSGRSPLAHNDGWSVEEAWEAMASDLAALSRMKTGLVVLFNASCYGAGAMSEDLKRTIRRSLERIEAIAPLTAVTTTSLFIARLLTRERPELELRASVNLRVGSVHAMEQLADSFDGYYLKRDLNRSPEAIERLTRWCADHGKRLHVLANSGCLRDCAYQSFHDNLVSHESDLRPKDLRDFSAPSPCATYLAPRSRWPLLLQNTWIRPEDLHHYERWFDTVKLATRMHSQPRKVLGAYSRGRYHGNLLELLEPGQGPLLWPWILANDRFPANWFEKTSNCSGNCDSCGYCASVLDQVLCLGAPPSPP